MTRLGFLFLTILIFTEAIVKWDGLKTLDADGKVRFFWKVESDKLRMRMEVDYLGYIAIGWDPEDNKMKNADMVILTKKENCYGLHLGDYFSPDMVKPAIDSSQSNLEPVEIGQSNFMTWMEFMVGLKATSSKDKSIKHGPVGVIWAYGRTMELEYHNLNRGFIEINFRGDKKEEEDEEDEEETEDSRRNLISNYDRKSQKNHQTQKSRYFF